MKRNFILPVLFIAVIVFTAGCSGPAATTTTSTTTTTTIATTTTYPSGDHTVSLFWDGQNRNYIYHIPTGADSSKSMPLVFCLHGAGGDAEQTVKFTHGGFNTLADRDGFFVIYPSALDGKWNDHRDPAFSQSDDVGFISELINQFIQNYHVDSARVYVTGMSNGSQMTMCLAREITNRLAAVAPVAYGMSEKAAALPVGTEPISVLVMTGTVDPLIPWLGGNATDMQGERMLGPTLSLAATVDVLTAFNHCNLTPAVTWIPDNDPHDGTRVRVEDYTGGSQGTEVMFYQIIGGGHAWPVGWQYPAIVLGGTSRDIDANEVIWAFFQKHSR